MKFFAIALFIFLLNISISVINTVDVLYTEVQPQDEYITEVQNVAGTGSYSETGVTSSSENFGFGDFVKAFWYFIKAVGMAIVGVYWLYTSFGLAPQLAILFSAPVYLLYIVGIAQFIGNRGMKNMS
jgi:hypothetical protein